MVVRTSFVTWYNYGRPRDLPNQCLSVSDTPSAKLTSHMNLMSFTTTGHTPVPHSKTFASLALAPGCQTTSASGVCTPERSILTAHEAWWSALGLRTRGMVPSCGRVKFSLSPRVPTSDPSNPSHAGWRHCVSIRSPHLLTTTHAVTVMTSSHLCSGSIQSHAHTSHHFSRAPGQCFRSTTCHS